MKNYRMSRQDWSAITRIWGNLWRSLLPQLPGTIHRHLIISFFTWTCCISKHDVAGVHVVVSFCGFVDISISISIYMSMNLKVNIFTFKFMLILGLMLNLIMIFILIKMLLLILIKNEIDVESGFR